MSTMSHGTGDWDIFRSNLRVNHITRTGLLFLLAAAACDGEGSEHK